MRKSLDKLAPPRRLNGKSEPWAVPNRVEVRCRAFEHKQTPVAEQSSNNLELPAVAVSREPDASINSDLAGNDAVCSTCPSRPSP